MKWNELTKLAISQGFRFESHGKKHDLYVNDKGQRIQLERHGSQEVRKGLLNAILKQIGLK